MVHCSAVPDSGAASANECRGLYTADTRWVRRAAAGPHPYPTPSTVATHPCITVAIQGQMCLHGRGVNAPFAVKEERYRNSCSILELPPRLLCQRRFPFPRPTPVRFAV